MPDDTTDNPNKSDNNDPIVEDSINEASDTDASDADASTGADADNSENVDQSDDDDESPASDDDSETTDGDADSESANSEDENPSEPDESTDGAGDADSQSDDSDSDSKPEPGADDQKSSEGADAASSPKRPFDIAAAEDEEAVAVDMPKTQNTEEGGAAVFAQSSRPADHNNDVEWPPKPEAAQPAATVSEAVQPQPNQPESRAPIADIVSDGSEQHIDNGAGVTNPGDGKKHRGKKLWLGILLVVIIILLACGYVFGVYLPNQPDAVYDASLTNTGKAVDQLVDYAKQEDQAGYKSASFDGQVNYSGDSVSADVSFNGKADEKSNSDIKLNGDVMGEKVGLNVKTVQAKDTLAPDLYFQVNGVKKLLDQEGLNSLDSLDGQWLKVDHTLLSSFSPQELNAEGKFKSADLPTSAEINDTMSQIESVNKEYLFTTDTTKAVLTDPDFIGKETVSGRTEYHYKVGYDKAHLEAYVAAEQKALDSSQLNTWYKRANDGKSLSDSLDFASLNKSIKAAPANYKFDLWADRDTKLVSKVQFADPKHADNKFTLSQNYTGGDVYPLTLAYTGKDDNGKPNDGSLSMNINSSTHKLSLSANVDAYESGQPTKLKLNVNVTPGKDYLKVTAPKGAESVNDLLSELGLVGTQSTTTQTQTQSQKAMTQSTLASAKTNLEMYFADKGSYPASKSTFLSWLKSSTGGNDASLAKQIQSDDYKYSATPKGCDGSHKICSDYDLTAAGADSVSA